MGIQNIVRWFLPKEDHFYDFLEKQAATAHEGAKALAGFSAPDANVESVRKAVQAFEHAGDKLVHEVEEALALTFVTPIDREDIQKLSAELDDILDLMNGAARAAVLFGVVRPSTAMTKLIAVLVRSTEVLAAALPLLRVHEYTKLIESTRVIRGFEKEGDIIFRDAISALFADPSVDAKVLLREKAVLEDLENALDHCDQLAATLTNLAIKHG
ncbi:MAG: DUF47 family protein [Sandaracinaceae bacterium]|nr:DUF47 family protein [Sandaracinaceae bacterium]